MKSYFAYIRVSTTRQGEEGISLQEQKAAIIEYATKHNMKIAEWFEEQLSAAKRGRPVFTRLLSLLKTKRASGVVIHKIDRGARNLKDWSDIGELMDQGIDVHFAHEGIDLHTRSGRLSGDILAVVAADYIRNLREEVIKGIRGRMRQGLFPFSAPCGYLNAGAGKPKTIDPIRGPLIKQAFELYVSGKYCLKELATLLFKKGLTSHGGKKVHISQLSTILRNPFYMGLIRLRNQKETYAGIHEPLVSSSIWNEVQFLMDGKRSRMRQPHGFLFRLMIRSEHCRRCLVGESHKGHTYYRAHCPICKISMRSERFEEAVTAVLKRITITPDEEPILKAFFTEYRTKEDDLTNARRRELEIELEQINGSLQSLLQKFLDSTIPKEMFDDGHSSLLMKKVSLEERLKRVSTHYGTIRHIENFINELRTLYERYSVDSMLQKRDIMRTMFENIVTNGTDIRITLYPIIELVAKREKTRQGWDVLFPEIFKAMLDNRGRLLK